MAGIAAVILGGLAGLMLAGAVAAVLVSASPSLRGPGTVWGVTVATVALCIWLSTRLVRSRGR
jgi:hypothetical protein